MRNLCIMLAIWVIVGISDNPYSLKASNQQQEISFQGFLLLFDESNIMIPDEYRKKYLPTSFNVYDELRCYSIKALKSMKYDYHLILFSHVSPLCKRDYILSYSKEGKLIDMLQLSEHCDQDLGYYQYEYTDYYIDEGDYVRISQTVVKEFVSDSTLYDKYGILIDHIIEKVDTEVIKDNYHYILNVDGKFKLLEEL